MYKIISYSHTFDFDLDTLVADTISVRFLDDPSYHLSFSKLNTGPLSVYSISELYTIFQNWIRSTNIILKENILFFNGAQNETIDFISSVFQLVS